MKIRALAFDTYGTVVDWRGSVLAELAAFGQARGLALDRERFLELHLAKFAGLPWDCIITAENARCYKPRAEVYRTAIELLGMAPAEVMMVAAHNYDLRAARAEGMRTAFVPRPTEYGPRQTTDLGPEDDWDVVAADLLDLAVRLGA